jgi:citrate lyase subunit beta/citryl-CoA lyase
MIHRALAPTPEEVEWAKGVVSAAEEAEEKGMGAVAYRGKMVDRPVLLRAKRVLELARAARMEVEDAA